MKQKLKQTKMEEIPEDWRLIEIKQSVDFIKGFEPGSKTYNKDGIGIRFLRVNDLTDKREDIIYSTSDNLVVVKKGDILLSLDGTPGIIAKNKEGAISGGIRKIEIKPDYINELDYNFLFYILHSNYVQRVIRMYSFGDIIKHASQSINHIKIFLPSLKEQKAIAEILSTVDESILKIDNAIDKTERLKRGFMEEFLTKGIKHKEFKNTEIGEIPKTWGLVRINQISRVRRGASPRPIADPKYFSEEGRGWIRISDVTIQYKYLKKTTQHLSKLGESKSIKVDQGDLIMSICATIGKPIIIDMAACIHDGFVVFRKLSKKINTEFLFYVLQRNESKFVNMKQTGTQGNLNTTLVGKTLIGLPLLEEQNKIVSMLTNLDKKISFQKSKKQKIERIKKGLMNELLTGEKRIRVAN